MSLVPRARDSSHSATATATARYTRKVAFTVNSVTMARPPSSSPTPSAAGRFRPARTGARAPGVPSAPDAAAPAGPSPGTSDLEELGFLVLEQLVHLPHVGVGELVELPLGPANLVLARVPALDQLVQRVLGIAADVADRHPAVLRLMPRDLDVLPPALLGELGEDHPDDGAVVRRVHPEVAVADRLLDRAQRRLVERLYHHHPRLRDVERRQLVHGGLGAVVLGRDLAEHGRVGAAGPDGAELLLGDRDGLVHLFLGPEEDIVYHCRSCRSLAWLVWACACSLRAVRTTLPLSGSAKTATSERLCQPARR